MITPFETRMSWVNEPSDLDPWLDKYLPDTKLVLDVGACDGLSTCRYAKRWPEALFVLFEPRNDNAELIEQNMKEFKIKNFELYRVALGSFDGATTFYKSYGQSPFVTDADTGNKSSSILKPKKHLDFHTWCKFDNSGNVPLRCLDNYKLFGPDFIHIDVQGAEIEVFEGGEKTLAGTKAIWCEVSTRELYEGQPLKHEVMKYLATKGFKAVLDTCENKTSGDIFFINEKA